MQVLILILISLYPKSSYSFTVSDCRKTLRDYVENKAEKYTETEPKNENKEGTYLQASEFIKRHRHSTDRLSEGSVGDLDQYLSIVVKKHSTGWKSRKARSCAEFLILTATHNQDVSEKVSKEFILKQFILTHEKALEQRMLTHENNEQPAKTLLARKPIPIHTLDSFDELLEKTSVLTKTTCKGKNLFVFDLDDTVLKTTKYSTVPIRNSESVLPKLNRDFTTLGLTARAVLTHQNSTRYSKALSRCLKHKKGNGYQLRFPAKIQASQENLQDAQIQFNFVSSKDSGEHLFKFIPADPPQLVPLSFSNSHFNIQTCDDIGNLVSFREGVLMVSHHNKGKVLKAFLNYLNSSSIDSLPRNYACILFADDKRENLIDMREEFHFLGENLHLFHFNPLKPKTGQAYQITPASISGKQDTKTSPPPTAGSSPASQQSVSGQAK